MERDDIKELITSGDAGSIGWQLIDCERDLLRRAKNDDED